MKVRTGTPGRTSPPPEKSSHSHVRGSTARPDVTRALRVATSVSVEGVEGKGGMWSPDLSLPFPFSLYPPYSLCVSSSLSYSFFVPLCLSPPFSLPLFLSLYSLSVSLYFFLTVLISLPLSLSTSPSLSVSVSYFLSSLSLPLSVSLTL